MRSSYSGWTEHKRSFDDLGALERKCDCPEDHAPLSDVRATSIVDQFYQYFVAIVRKLQEKEQALSWYFVTFCDFNEVRKVVSFIDLLVLVLPLAALAMRVLVAAQENRIFHWRLNALV